MTDQAKGLILTCIGVLAVIPDSLIVRLIDTDGLTFLFVRSGLAGLVIGLFTAMLYRKKTIQTYQNLGWTGLQYAVLLCISTFCFIYGLRLTSVANALFIVSTSPIFAAIASWIFLQEQFSKRMIWTTAFALIGISIITLGSHTGEKSSLLGDALALSAAATLAFAFTTARSAKNISMVPATGIGYGLTAVICLPFIQLASLSGHELILLILLGAMFVPLGTALMSLGPRYITASEVSLLLLLEAVLAPLLVWYVVEENPGKYALIGGAIVLTTLFASNVIGLKRTQKKPYAQNKDRS
ncbi:MAG TPA: EamA family transporter [Rhodobacteraceae bacterium]|nr:EamA family transporter [Paracoccaceae bacterium]